MNPLPFTITADAISWIRQRTSHTLEAQGTTSTFLPRLCLVNSIRESDEAGNIIAAHEELHLGLGFDRPDVIKELNLLHFHLEEMIIYIDSAAVAYCTGKIISVISVPFSETSMDILVAL